MAPVIVDTGPIIALLDRKEEHHLWSSEHLRNLRKPLLTCDAVLTEACFLLAEYPHVLRQLGNVLDNQFIISDFESASQTSRIFDLMETYQNIPMSFADACLVCLVESHPGATVFTLDRD